jgi:hypothetical protein
MNTENVSIQTFFNEEEISRVMELCYDRRLLLDFGKGCSYHGIQATRKTGRRRRRRKKT